MRSENVRFIVTMPRVVKDWIESEAERDERSQNAIIVRTIKAQMLAQREQNEQREQTVR